MNSSSYTTALSTLEARAGDRAQRRARQATNRQTAKLVGPAPTAMDAKRVDGTTLTQAFLLNWLGQQPVAFHRVFVDIAGSVLAAIWLSHVMDRMALAGSGATDADGDYSFTMTGHECEQATGITRAQQVTCRRLLVDQGLLSEDGEERKAIQYRIHLNRLSQRLLQQAGTLAQNMGQQVGTDALSRSTIQRSA